jgi:hypothetical protein
MILHHLQDMRNQRFHIRWGMCIHLRDMNSNFLGRSLRCMEYKAEVVEVVVVVVVLVLVMNIHFAYACEHHKPSSGDSSWLTKVLVLVPSEGVGCCW